MPDEYPRCHCNHCGRTTEHDLIDSREVEEIEVYEEGEETEHAEWWTDHYEVLQCRGCRAVRLKHTFDHPSGEKQVSYYPPPVSRRAPGWRFRLPQAMRELLDEIYIALHGNSRRLVLMGARTLVDMLVLENVGDVGSFQRKLETLEQKGFIAGRNREILAAALDAGNAAAHRGYRPQPYEMNAVIDIIENLLQATYHLPHVAEDLKQTTPPRDAKK